MTKPHRTRTASPDRARSSIKRGNTLVIGVLLFGLAVFLFPIVADAINARSHSYSIRSYEDQVARLSPAERDAIRRSAEQRNRDLADAGPSVSDPFADDNASAAPGVSHIDLRQADVIAHLEVPKMNLNLPIFEGIDDSVLQRGVGHIPNSSLPVGGDTTHSVLTAHRGLPTATLFRNLDTLALGDTFFVHSLGNTLGYRVVAIDVVSPSDFHRLRIEQNRDLVTLVTCTPYMVNTHRLLVTGERVPFTAEPPGSGPVAVPPAIRGWLQQWALWLLVPVAGVAVWILVRVRSRYRRSQS